MHTQYKYIMLIYNPLQYYIYSKRTHWYASKQSNTWVNSEYECEVKPALKLPLKDHLNMTPPESVLHHKLYYKWLNKFQKSYSSLGHCNKQQLDRDHDMWACFQSTRFTLILLHSQKKRTKDRITWIMVSSQDKAAQGKKDEGLSDIALSAFS